MRYLAPDIENILPIFMLNDATSFSSKSFPPNFSPRKPTRNCSIAPMFEFIERIRENQVLMSFQAVRNAFHSVGLTIIGLATTAGEAEK